MIDDSKAAGANADDRPLAQSARYDSQPPSGLAFFTDSEVSRLVRQTQPLGAASEWEVRHEQALATEHAARVTSWLGVGVMAGGAAMALTETLTRKSEQQCLGYYLPCIEVTRTNKPLGAGGWFTMAAGVAVVGFGASQGASAGSELAALEAEKLRVRHENATVSDIGKSTANPWANVSGLQPGQFVTLEVTKGQGKNSVGWFIQADDQQVTLYDGKRVVAIDKAAVRRIRAVPLGKERYGPKGWAIAMAGILGSLGAMTLMEEQHGLFEDITGTQFGVLVGAVGVSTVTGLVVAKKGGASTVYELDSQGVPRPVSLNSNARASEDARLRTHSEKGVALMMSRKSVGVVYVAKW